MGFSDLQESFFCAVHKIMTAATVNVDVDKAGRDELPPGVDLHCSRDIQIAFGNFGNPAPRNSHRTVNDTPGG